MKCMALINQFIGYWEYNTKLVVVKSNFSILLVPNYRVFRITVIYVTGAFGGEAVGGGGYAGAKVLP